MENIEKYVKDSMFSSVTRDEPRLFYGLQAGYLTIFDEELEINLKDNEPFLLNNNLKSLSSKEHYSSLTPTLEKIEFFWPSKKVKWQAFCKNKKLHGPSISYFTDGGVASEIWYFNGCKQGRARFFSKSGKLLVQKHFKDNFLHGAQLVFDECGRLKAEFFFLYNKLHGDANLYYPNGSLWRQMHFEYGLKNGEDRVWNDKGDEISRLVFKKGKMDYSNSFDQIASSYGLH